MKILILSNFGPNNRIFGGSEYVIENISINLIKNYNYKISVSAFNYNKVDEYKNIKLFPCLRGKFLIDKLNSYDHVFIYSDSFWELKNVFNNINRIKPKITLALVGAYSLQTHPEYLKILKEDTDKFNLIVHSDITIDYLFCKKNNLPVDIISNGINIDSFKNNNLSFRKKYNIKERYIILNIANFFFGKNQHILGKISKELRKKRDDFIFVQISSSIKYPYEKTFLDRAKRAFNNEKCLFLRNIPREDVVSAFKNSDIFINTSGKEVSPIVILESLCAGLPVLSMTVGDVENYPVIIINNKNIDKKGYKIVDNKIIKEYVDNIIELLNNQELREKIISDGQKNIEQLDWKNIVPKYNEVFRRL